VTIKGFRDVDVRGRARAGWRDDRDIPALKRHHFVGDIGSEPF